MLIAIGRNCNGLVNKHPHDASRLPCPWCFTLQLSICAALGVLERFGLFNEGQAPSFSRRDRHLRLKFEHLVTALQEYLPLQVGLERYTRVW